MPENEQHSLIDRWIYFFLANKLVVFLLIGAIIGSGLYVLPFSHPFGWWPSDPVPVDAIPDIGENQQIIFTQWSGRSPQDVEDQITYPLSVALQGIPGVKSIRSQSMFGFSSVYVIFEDDIEFYWSRSRILERLNSVSKDLPPGVTPTLGPDATALGQIFWYTLEGHNPKGEVVGGWSLEELRSIQDWQVRYSLQETKGISEVASVGGFVREYQIDVDPDAMRAYQVKLPEIFQAVKRANIDVGAKTLEHNGVEYVIRGLGFVKSVSDLEKVVITSRNNVPVFIRNIARVKLGPALRRGALDKAGAEAVGGVAVVRYGENPLKVIKRLKEKIADIAPALPKKTLADGTTSQVSIVPFYDRTQLIEETLGTLKTALVDEVLLTVVVIVLFIMNLRLSLIVSLNLPLSILISFMLMKLLGVDSHIMSLSGLAIAIGAIVDMGIIMSENIVRHYDQAPKGKRDLATTFRASSEVGGAVFTAICTTVVSFLPVFAMDGREGKLFHPLAYTKTFALIASIICALSLIPALCHLLLGDWRGSRWLRDNSSWGWLLLAATVALLVTWWLALVVLAVWGWRKLSYFIPEEKLTKLAKGVNALLALAAIYLLTKSVMPFGYEHSFVSNFVFLSVVIAGILGFFMMIIAYYQSILGFLLRVKKTFLAFAFTVTLLGITLGLGFEATFSPFLYLGQRLGIEQKSIESNPLWVWGKHTFPGFEEEFMPPFNEGSFLYMPVIMPHGSIGEALDILQKQDTQISKIPEVSVVVGKIGRVESPLDPAPVSMIETIIQYKSEYSWQNGRRVRQWREHIQSPDDIWQEILEATKITGATSAPPLQPIEARLVMLQTGMRAPMGVKIRKTSNKDLKEILGELEEFGLQLEKFLQKVPGVDSDTVLADRVVGKPYLEFLIDREKIARYGVNIQDVQNVIEVAIGGQKAGEVFQGRERYPIQVRYKRELRDSIEALQKILIPTSSGAQIPITQVAELKYVRGPQVIKSENGFLVSYVLFDKQAGYSEVEVVENAREYLLQMEEQGKLVRPSGTDYLFAGNYENQVRSKQRLQILLPICLVMIFLIIYFKFQKISLTLIIFLAIPVTLSGGFYLLWLYSQDWFLNFSLLGVNLREIFQIQTYNLSIAVWVGFIAVFGIASDDAVVTATYLEEEFKKRSSFPSIEEIRQTTITAGSKRIRPCLMTTGTTILALLPVLMSSGRGAEVMIPMALPSVGGMLLAVITLFVVPVVYCASQESAWKTNQSPSEN